MARPSILIVSNGYGEDAVGAAIGRLLLPRVEIVACPLVGHGGAYGDLPLIGPLRDLPSGGFGIRGTGFLADLLAGGLGHWWHQRRTLRARQGQYDLAIAVGDTFCLWMAGAAGTPAILIATAKSSRHDPHGWLDVASIRRLAVRVFARDEETAAALRACGIHAECLGNPLMDTIGGSPSAGVRRPDRHVAVLLPGSRSDAYANLGDLLRLADVVGQATPVIWLCQLAPGLDRDAINAKTKEIGWTTEGTYLRKGTGEVLLTRDFGGAVRDADVVIGLAGTANEQAAGLGKPVVAFPDSGPQFTPRFLAAQQRLLGDALVATPTWIKAAAVVLRLLRSPEERLRRGATGRIRMGPPGGIARIAGEILTILNAQARKRANAQAEIS